MSDLQTPQSAFTLSNDYKIPCLGYGTWRTDDRTALSAVKIALETGYRHIDTAAGYKNESGVGEAVKESGLAPGAGLLYNKGFYTNRGDGGSL